MVTHDYERGMITGLPRSVVDEVRRTGKLPRGAIHPSMVDVWDALAEQRRHQLPPGMTVADIQRQRDGWDEAFDPEVWERLSGEKGAPLALPGMEWAERKRDEVARDVASSLVNSWRCGCWQGESANGDYCTVDGVEGAIVDAGSDWTWNLRTNLCEQNAKCRLGPCSCYDAGEGLLYGADALTEAKINATCGMDGGHDPLCLKVRCTERTDGSGCECDLYCAEKGNGCKGSWQPILSGSKPKVWDLCADDDRFTLKAVATRKMCRPPPEVERERMMEWLEEQWEDKEARDRMLEEAYDAFEEATRETEIDDEPSSGVILGGRAGRPGCTRNDCLRAAEEGDDAYYRFCACVPRGSQRLCKSIAVDTKASKIAGCDNEGWYR